MKTINFSRFICLFSAIAVLSGCSSTNESETNTISATTSIQTEASTTTEAITTEASTTELTSAETTTALSSMTDNENNERVEVPATTVSTTYVEPEELSPTWRNDALKVIDTVLVDGVRYNVTECDVKTDDGLFTIAMSGDKFIYSNLTNAPLGFIAGKTAKSRIPYSQITFDNICDAFPFINKEYVGYNPGYLECPKNATNSEKIRILIDNAGTNWKDTVESQDKFKYANKAEHDAALAQEAADAEADRRADEYLTDPNISPDDMLKDNPNVDFSEFGRR